MINVIISLLLSVLSFFFPCFGNTGAVSGNVCSSTVSSAKVDSKGCRSVTAVDPTSVDTCGSDSDSYTIPTTTGVDYQINGQTVAAGTYLGTDTVTISAVSQQGYVLQGTTTWTFTFTNESCQGGTGGSGGSGGGIL